MARVKRPVPERERPIRSWTAAVGPNPAPPAGGPSAPRADGPRLDQDPVVRGVVSGGQVVDEWIRQAQQTARLLGGAASAPWADTSGQMLRTFSEMMGAWWSMLGIVPPNGGNGSSQAAAKEPVWAPSAAAQPQAEPAPPTAASHSTSSQSAAGPRVRIAVASVKPVDVTLDLYRPGATSFRVLDLRPDEGDAPRIQGTTLEMLDGEGCRLQLHVPDNQPRGTYRAVILDTTLDCVVGAVTLRVS